MKIISCQIGLKYINLLYIAAIPIRFERLLVL